MDHRRPNRGHDRRKHEGDIGSNEAENGDLAEDTLPPEPRPAIF